MPIYYSAMASGHDLLRMQNTSKNKREKLYFPVNAHSAWAAATAATAAKVKAEKPIMKTVALWNRRFVPMCIGHKGNIFTSVETAEKACSVHIWKVETNTNQTHGKALDEKRKTTAMTTTTWNWNKNKVRDSHKIDNYNGIHCRLCVRSLRW